MKPRLALFALLLFAPFALAGTYLAPISEGPIYEGNSVRIPIGTYWADIRVYSLGIEGGYAHCTGNGSSRSCGPCPVTEDASFIVTLWNGTETRLSGIAENSTQTVEKQFKLTVTRVEENLFVDNLDAGHCAYTDARVTFQFSPYVECASDSDCDSGKGCANYYCVSSECNSNAQCAQDENCTFHQCVSIRHGTCGEVGNHTWVPYQCCDDGACSSGLHCMRNTCRLYRLCTSNGDCLFDEHCSSYTSHCEIVPSTSCGTYGMHSWTNFSCCNDSACGPGTRCISHECLGCTSDSDCPLNASCRSNSCVPFTGCGLIANHTFTPYECCSNSDCFDEFFCSNHSCDPVRCQCGQIANHICVTTECATPTPTPTPVPRTPTPAPTPAPTPQPSTCPVVFLLPLGLIAAALFSRKGGASHQ